MYPTKIEAIRALADEGLNHTEIGRWVGRSRSTILRHLDPAERLRTNTSRGVRKKSIKAELVGLFGGKCVVCGYSFCVAALEFHHLDPALKDKGVARFSSLKAAIKEAEKCALLCCRCHAEVEAGMTELPSSKPPVIFRASTGFDCEAETADSV
jgi:helix-turn-helix protein